MDLIRSCYTTRMRFWSDSDLSIPVRWFFAKEDAEVFPGYHRFGSGNWASQRSEWDGPGEVLGAARPWSDGFRPVGLIGDHHCGPDKGYSEGTVFPGIPLDADEYGIAPCCVEAPPPCSAYWLTLPDELEVYVYSVVSSTPPTIQPGTRFRVRKLFPVPGSGYTSFPDNYFQPGGGACPCGGWFVVDCLSHVGLVCGKDPILHIPASVIELEPFRAWFPFVNVATLFAFPNCETYGVSEMWGLVISAIPPD